MLPSGWGLNAYLNDAAAWMRIFPQTTTARWCCSSTTLPPTTRVTQEVYVQPNTVYRLSADIRTNNVQYGTGANLSIDNYPLDGTYCYSENLFGSDAWRTVMLYFRTAEEQTVVNVALRLGGGDGHGVGGISQCIHV
ncbi:MAG: hypothetical protein R2881_09305 [Eubacteriales bacterium]